MAGNVSIIISKEMSRLQCALCWRRCTGLYCVGPNLDRQSRWSQDLEEGIEIAFIVIAWTMSQMSMMTFSTVYQSFATKDMRRLQWSWLLLNRYMCWAPNRMLLPFHTAVLLHADITMPTACTVRHVIERRSHAKDVSKR